MDIVIILVVVFAVVSFFGGTFGGIRVIKVVSFHTGEARLPGLLRKQNDERVIIRAASPAGRAQTFVTNKRFIIHTRTWLGSASRSSYMPIEKFSPLKSDNPTLGASLCLLP